jgi:hypothetical protein
MAIAKSSKVKITPAAKVSSTVRRGIDKRDWQKIKTSMNTEGVGTCAKPDLCPRGKVDF